MDIQSSFSLKTISHTDWLNFGVNEMAYLRPAVVNGQPIYAIHAADGAQLALVASRDIGIAAMQQHELEPATLQ